MSFWNLTARDFSSETSNRLPRPLAVLVANFALRKIFIYVGAHTPYKLRPNGSALLSVTTLRFFTTIASTKRSQRTLSLAKSALRTIFLYVRVHTTSTLRSNGSVLLSVTILRSSRTLPLRTLSIKLTKLSTSTLAFLRRSPITVSTFHPSVEHKTFIISTLSRLIHPSLSQLTSSTSLLKSPIRTSQTTPSTFLLKSPIPKSAMSTRIL